MAAAAVAAAVVVVVMVVVVVVVVAAAVTMAYGCCARAFDPPAQRHARTNNHRRCDTYTQHTAHT